MHVVVYIDREGARKSKEKRKEGKEKKKKTRKTGEKGERITYAPCRAGS